MSNLSINHIVGTGPPASDYVQPRFTPAPSVDPTVEGFWCPLPGSQVYHDYSVYSGGDIAPNTVLGSHSDRCTISTLPAESQAWEFCDEIFDFKPVGQALTAIPRSCKIHGLDKSSIQPGILSFANGLQLSGGRASSSPVFTTASFALYTFSASLISSVLCYIPSSSLSLVSRRYRKRATR